MSAGSRASDEKVAGASPDRPRASVVMAAYNSAHCLPATLDSLLAQTMRPHEIIVVNDGSADATGEVARRHPVGAMVVDQPNAGMCAARNTGIEAATGDLICILDSDDLWHPLYVERMTGMMQDHPEAVCGFAMYRPWQHPVEEPAPWEGEVATTTRVHDLHSYFDFHRQGLPVLPSFQVTRRDALRRLGDRPYREDQIQGEAAFLFALLAAFGPVVEHEGPLGRYRMHANAVTGDEMDAARRFEPCMDDLVQAARGGLGLGLDFPRSVRRSIERHAADWYRRCGRRLGGGGELGAGRRQLAKAAKLGDRTAAAMLVLGFLPGLRERIWTRQWRPDAVRRESGLEAWSIDEPPSGNGTGS